MSNIKISKKVIADLFNRKATYIKKNRLIFDRMCFGKDKITFENKRGTVLATIEIPSGVNFNSGETVTVNFGGSMRIYLTEAE